MSPFRRLCSLAGLVLAGTWSAAGCGSDSDKSTEPTQPLDADFTYTVEECSPEAPAKVLAEMLPVASVSGNTVSFSHFLETFCNAKSDQALALRASIEGREITIQEIFKGPAVRCNCNIPVSGQLENLEPGTYTLRFVYQEEAEGGTAPEPQVLHELSLAVGAGADAHPMVDAGQLLTEADSGRAVQLSRIGAQLALVLAANPSTGYRWEVESTDASILRQVGEEIFVASSEALGAGGWVILRFQTAAPGQTVLRLIYRRPWEQETPPLKVFAVTVGVG